MEEVQMKKLLAPFLGEASVPQGFYAQLCRYLDLLTRWSEKTNLTAIRNPVDVVLHHFGESLFLGRHLPSGATLLDYGSGAGFPGLPIQLLLPDLRVTLAESQGKKASFLQEAVRVLMLKTEVWPGRVESMPAERRFDLVALRAVDKMEKAVAAAMSRVADGGTLATFVSQGDEGLHIPGSTNKRIRFISR